MRVYCAQINQVWDDPDSAFEKAEEVVKCANADMVVFCEQYATGWKATPSKYSGEEIKNRWLSLARKYNVCIVGSYQKYEESSAPQNVMLVCARDGSVLAEYAKIHLFSPACEDKNFSPGCCTVDFEFEGVKFGCAVCFDLRFPDIFTDYMKKGCHAVIIHAAWAAARTADFELLLRARALENRMYVAGCNCLGYGNDTDFSGRSMICDPDGRIIADAGVFEGGALWEFDSEWVVFEVEEARKKWCLSG